METALRQELHEEAVTPRRQFDIVALSLGYNLHITRRKQWSDEGDASISLNEWRSYVESDPELRVDDSLGEHFVVWSGPSTHDVPWLAWANGNIETKNPDQPLIRKMVSIASALGANV